MPSKSPPDDDAEDENTGIKMYFDVLLQTCLADRSVFERILRIDRDGLLADWLD